MAFLQDALTTLGDTIGGSTVTHSTTTTTTTPPPAPGKNLLLPIGIGAIAFLLAGLVMALRQPRQIIVQPTATV